MEDFIEVLQGCLLFDGIAPKDVSAMTVTEDGSVGASRAVPYRADAVLAAAKGCGHISAFDGETRLWHAWTAAGWHVEEDPFAPDFADMVDHLRNRAEQTGGDEVLPF